MTLSPQKTLYQTIQQSADVSLGWFAALLAFSIPVSTSAVSVMAVLILGCWLIGG